MNVIQTQPVEIALRTLGEEDRQKVVAWLDHLKNWENDAFVRGQAKQVGPDDRVFVLNTSTDFVIFFRLEKDRIVLLDVATKATLLSFGRVAEHSQT